MNINANTVTADEYREAVALKAQIEADTARLAVLTASLADATGVGTHTINGGGSFNVSENNTYDQDVMRKALKPGQIKRCEVRKMDNALVKTLYPHVHAAAKVTRGLKVTLKG